jgi:hypothetical protein
MCGGRECYDQDNPCKYTCCARCERILCKNCKEPENKMCNRCTCWEYEKEFANSMNILSESKIFEITSSRSRDIRGLFEGKYLQLCHYVRFYHADDCETIVKINGIHCYSIFPLKFDVVTPETVHQELVNAIKHYDVLGNEYKMIEMNKAIRWLQERKSSILEKIEDHKNDVRVIDVETILIQCEINKIS